MIGILALVSAVCEVIGFIFYFNRNSTSYLFNLFATAQFVLLSIFYLEILIKGRKKLEASFGLFHYFLSFLLLTYYTQKLFEYQKIIWVVSSLIILIYAIAFSIKLHRTTPRRDIHKYAATWINYGVLVYFGTAVWIFLGSDYIFQHLSPTDTRSVWAIHNLLNIIKNGFYGVGILLSIKVIVFGVPKHKKESIPVNIPDAHIATERPHDSSQEN